MCAHHRTPNAASSVAWSPPASAPPTALAMNAPGTSPYAATWKHWARSSVATTPAMSPRISRASRLSVRRGGFVTSRRQYAYAIAASTTTATAFCIAMTAAHSAPSHGIDRTASMRPPVTMFAVPTVSRTKPQKIPAWSSPARTSRNIRVWTRP